MILAAEQSVSAADDFRGKRVTVMGLGRFEGGVGVTRWLAAQGARVLVTDRDPPEKLSESLAAVGDLPIELRLGGHDARDFVNADLVVVNPAVPPTSEFIAAAIATGIPVTTEINLFVERCRASTVGVTGSVGKSTTTAMIGHVLERTLAGRRVWVGGNLGRSLLDALPQVAPQDVVVLELSSFQLERTPLVRWSPNIAVVTNVAANHLDWHGTFAAYLAAKLNIVRFQQPDRDTIVIGDDAGLREAFDRLFGDLSGIWRAGVEGRAPMARRQSTAAVDCDDEQLAWDDVRLLVPGLHNLQNAAVALCVANALGARPDDAAAAIASFAGLEHRLQLVATIGGVAYYNDSKSTTPQSAVTAMNAIETPLLVILGGYDKKIDLTPAIEAAARRARYAACVGATGRVIAARIAELGGQAEFFETFEAAVAACRPRAREGDSVLLSPACASWGMFADYRARGEAFIRLVRDGAAQ